MKGDKTDRKDPREPIADSEYKTDWKDPREPIANSEFVDAEEWTKELEQLPFSLIVNPPPKKQVTPVNKAMRARHACTAHAGCALPTCIRNHVEHRQNGKVETQTTVLANVPRT